MFKDQDLEKLAKGLEISPSMYKEAVDRYNAMAHFLQKKGIDADIYPQGSFQTGTVVRPLKDGQEADFDIDLVCEMRHSTPDSADALPTKLSVGDALKSDATYASKLQPEQDRCWTLQYADVQDGIGLQMDIVPCVHETQQKIGLLCSKSVAPRFADSAVEITEKLSEQHYGWIASNPKGYADWFNEINARFFTPTHRQEKQIFLNENRGLFSTSASVDDVPDYYIRTNLQRVIQLLKRHRDIYYHRTKRPDLCPSSIIITTLAAQIAQNSPSLGLSDLLAAVARGLSDYADLLQGKLPRGAVCAEEKKYIRREDQRWHILNPVDPEDNFADAWTDETANMFFRWIACVERDLVTPTPEHFYSGLITSFGADHVRKCLQNSEPSAPAVTRPKIETPPQLERPTKPWGTF